jgi:hypothetical protein
MLPIDGPLTRVYIQELKDGDFSDLPGKHKSLYIFKCHHALGDGVSLGALTLAATDDYDLSYFPAAKTASLWEVILLRLMAYLAIPQMMWHMLTTGKDKNLLTMRKRKEGLSGKIHCTSSRDQIMVDELK